MLLLLALACNGKDGKTDGDNTDAADDTSADTGDTQQQPPELHVTEAPSGELECFDGEVRKTTLPGGELTAEPQLEAYDPLTDAGTPSASIRIWYGEDVEGDPDVGRSADEEGVVGLTELAACTQLNTTATVVRRSSPDTGAEDVSLTTDLITVVGPETTNLKVAAFELNTYLLVAQQAGLELGQGKGMILGEVTDCAGAPLDNVEITYDLPVGGTFYFDGGSVSQGRQWTSADGRFVLLNADAAPGRITAWVWDGEKHAALASASVRVSANGVRWISLKAAREGEVNLPSGCETE